MMNLHLAAGFVSKPLSGASCRTKTTSLDVRVRAEDGFCRDKIAFPVERGAVDIEGESTLVFLGAGGKSVEVTGRKVRWRNCPQACCASLRIYDGLKTAFFDSGHIHVRFWAG